MVARFEDEQLRWLVEVAGRRPVELLGGTLPDDLPTTGSVLESHEQFEAITSKKEKRLQAVRTKLEDSKSKIRALMDIEVTLKDGTRVKAFSGSKLWNPDEEFDAVHHMHLTTDESLSGAEIERLKAGCEQLASLRNVLTGTLAPGDWPKIYEQHIQQQQSVEEIAEQWMVGPEAVQQAIDRYAVFLQKAGVAPQDPRFMKALLEQPPVREEQPLFTDLEIRREFFDPLVREKILPDNEVEDRFNSTYQVFTGASEEYKQTLREFSSEVEEDPELTQLRQFTTTTIKGAAKIGTELVGILGKLSDVQEVVDVSKLAADVLKLVEQAGLVAVSSIDQFYGKQVEGLVDQVGGALETALKMALGRDAADYAKWARAGYASTVNIRELADALMKRDQGWVDKALEQLSAGLESALSIGGNENAARLGKGLKHALLLKVNGKKVYDYLQQDPPAFDLITLTIGKAATSAFKDILGDSVFSSSTEGETQSEDKDTPPSEPLSKEQERELEEKKEAEDEYSSAIEEIAGELDSGIDQLVQGIEEARQPLESLKNDLAQPETLRELTAKMENVAAERLRLDIESELKGLPGGELPGEDNNLEQDFVEIQPLIAEVKKSGVYLKLADSLLDAGLKAVGEFVAIVKVASAGKGLLKNILVAYGKKRQLYQWKTLREDALAAASISSSSFAAKIKDLDFEFSEARYKSLLSLADTLGASLTTILDPTGVAGEVISKSSSASGALLDIVLEGRKAADLSRAWQAYLDALRNPGDRIKLREAIHRNSTLAKYALAYAALHDGDRLAQAGLAQVGLTEEVLRDPSAKVKDVVTYLEAKWASDPTNMKKLFVPGDWQADKTGDLTVDAWLSNMFAASGEKLGEDRVVKANTGAVEGALLKLAEARTSRDVAVQQLQQVETSYLLVADPLAESWNLYRPSSAACDGLKSELMRIQKLATEANRALKLKRKEEAWADKAQRAEILKSHLQVITNAKIDQSLADIFERIDDFNSAAEQLLPRASKFLQDSQRYVEALEQLPLRQQSVIELLGVLKQALRGCQYEREDGKPSEAVTQYVRSVISRVDDALRDSQRDHAQDNTRLSEVQLRRSQAAQLPGEVAARRKELAKLAKQAGRFRNQYRTYFVQLNKQWQEARSSG